MPCARSISNDVLLGLITGKKNDVIKMPNDCVNID